MEEEVKKPKKKKRRNKLLFMLFIYLAVVMLLIAAVYLFPKLNGALTKTMTITYGTLDKSYDATCYIVRDETVYYSDQDAAVGYYYDEGTGVRAGTDIVTLTAEKGAKIDDSVYSGYNKQANSTENPLALLHAYERKDNLELALRESYDESDSETEKTKINNYIGLLTEFTEKKESSIEKKYNESDNSLPETVWGEVGSTTAKTSGILSYMLDGYEEDFHPYTMELLEREELEKRTYDVFNVCTGHVKKGEPLFKIIDNHRWYAVTWIEPSQLGIFSEGSMIKLKLPKASVKGTVDKLYDDGEKVMMIIAFNSYYQELGSIRRVETQLLSSDTNGLLIDNSFIATKDGVPGVYVIDIVGDATFTPVKILDSDGTNSLVSSGYYYETDENGASKQVATVNVYDEIKKPDADKNTGSKASGSENAENGAEKTVKSDEK